MCCFPDLHPLLYNKEKESQSCEGEIWGTSSADVRCHVHVRGDHVIVNIPAFIVFYRADLQMPSQSPPQVSGWGQSLFQQRSPWFGFQLADAAEIPSVLGLPRPPSLPAYCFLAFFPAVPWVLECHFPGSSSCIKSLFRFQAMARLTNSWSSPSPPTFWRINFHYWFCVKVFRVPLCLTPVVT